MALDALNGSQGLSGGVWAQLQQQQAQRTAEQAETRARQLKAAADDAQNSAEHAREKARVKRVDSDKAQTDASEAKSNLANLKSVSELQTQMTDLRQGIKTALGNDNWASSAAVSPVINAYGQTTGSLINETA